MCSPGHHWVSVYTRNSSVKFRIQTTKNSEWIFSEDVELTEGGRIKSNQSNFWWYICPYKWRKLRGQMTSRNWHCRGIPLNRIENFSNISQSTWRIIFGTTHFFQTNGPISLFPCSQEYPRCLIAVLILKRVHLLSFGSPNYWADYSRIYSFRDDELKRQIMWNHAKHWENQTICGS